MARSLGKRDLAALSHESRYEGYHPFVTLREDELKLLNLERE